MLLMSRERGRCSDTLSDALDAVTVALESVGRIEGNDSRSSDLASLLKTHLIHYGERLRVLQEECSRINHGRRDDPNVLRHNAEVDAFATAPFIVSRWVSLGQLYAVQLKHESLGGSRKFAECLAASMMAELNIDSVPFVVFADQFQIVDLDSRWIVSVPLVFRERHRGWWALAHEVGHIVASRVSLADKSALFGMLDEYVKSESQYENNRDSFDRLLIQWILFWLPELLADYIGLSLFGFYYLVELKHLDTGLDFGTISTSHPPMSFRLACMRAILLKREPTARVETHAFEARSPVPKGIDPLVYSLVTEKAVETYADWLVSLPIYHEIPFHWSDVLDPGEGEAVEKHSISTLFAVLGLLSIEEDASELYEILKRKCAERRAHS